MKRFLKRWRVMTVTLILLSWACLLEALLLKNQYNWRLDMNKQMVYSPQDFLERLINDDFRRPLIITGMIKKAENSDQFLFTIGTSCANWRKVPLNIIDNIEVLNFVPCNDHAHPMVKMTFKEPESEESLLFASLATDIMDETKNVVNKLKERPSVFDDDPVNPNQPCIDCFNNCLSQGINYFDCVQNCAPLCPGVTDIMDKDKSPIIAHPAPRKPQISASIKSVNGNNILSIAGGGFKPGDIVKVQIDTIVDSQKQSGYQVPVQADNFGSITVPDQGVNCTSDHLTIYQATATGTTGSSNTAGVSC